MLGLQVALDLVVVVDVGDEGYYAAGLGTLAGADHAVALVLQAGYQAVGEG